MNLRERLLACALAVAVLLFVSGVALFDGRLAFLVGGVLFGCWSWLVLAGDDDEAPE